VLRPLNRSLANFQTWISFPAISRLAGTDLPKSLASRQTLRQILGHPVDPAEQILRLQFDQSNSSPRSTVLSSTQMSVFRSCLPLNARLDERAAGYEEVGKGVSSLVIRRAPLHNHVALEHTAPWSGEVVQFRCRLNDRAVGDIQVCHDVYRCGSGSF
jgi:hypothetical protein